MNACGSFPFAALPQTLQVFDISDSMFSGKIDWKGLPRDLLYFNVNNNDFEGEIDIGAIPANIHSDCFHIENTWLDSIKHPDYIAKPCDYF